MLPFLTPDWLIAFAAAATFLAMGRFEAQRGTGRDWSLPWAGLSIVLSATVIEFFAGGWAAVLIAQVVLYVGIAAVGVMVDARR